MKSIPDENWKVHAEDPMALTQLLGLSEFVVQAIEYDATQDCLYVQCEHA